MTTLAYHELTKADVAALRQADHISVHLSATDPSLNAVVCTKRLERKDSDPFGDTERRYQIGQSGSAAPVGIQYQHDRDHSAARCFGHIWCYPSQHDHVSSVLRTLRAGESIAFVFYTDAGSNGYAAAAGLHCDRLLLNVRDASGRTKAQWQMLMGISPSNSARMVRDVPDSAEYQRNAERTRAHS